MMDVWMCGWTDGVQIHSLETAVSVSVAKEAAARKECALLRGQVLQLQEELEAQAGGDAPGTTLQQAAVNLASGHGSRRKRVG